MTMKILKAVPYFLILGIVAVLSFSLGVPATQAAETWDVKYWNNRNLSGDPVVVGQESEINHDWGQGSPSGVADDNFSARWRRTINVPAGTYRFAATMDDGMRIWVDDQLILDSWYDSAAHSLAPTVSLGAGDHNVKVEYYDAGGDAVAKLRIEPVNVPGERWRGEYFNNTSLSGSPVLVRDDDRIDFNWGGGSPGPNVAADNFSVRWTRTLNLEPGRYRWTSETDDGARLWVNGRLLIDKWFDQSAGAHSAEIDLPGGATDVRMEFFENAGGARARLTRLKLDGSASGTVWRGEYFNNKNLSGKPDLVRNDDHIDFNWGNGSPAANINKDNFSVRWTRDLNLSPGRYRFTAVTDDGVRLWVNGQQIINQWTDRRPTTSSGEITLPGGTAKVVMEYYENVGGARAQLTRTQVNTAPAPTPTPPAASGTVPGLRLNMRSGPSPIFDIIRVLPQGERVTLSGRNAAATWIYVTAGDGLKGWVYAPLLQTTVPVASLPLASGEVVTPPPGSGSSKTATVSNAIFVLNVRSGPGATFEPITTLSRGQMVELLGRNSSSAWLQVRTPGGTVGWSSARYLDTTYPLNNLPVTA